MFCFVHGAISVPHSLDDCYFSALPFWIHTFLAESKVLIHHRFLIDKYFLLSSVRRLHLFNCLYQIQIHKCTQHSLVLRLIQAPWRTLVIPDNMLGIPMHSYQHPLRIRYFHTIVHMFHQWNWFSCLLGNGLSSISPAFDCCYFIPWFAWIVPTREHVALLEIWWFKRLMFVSSYNLFDQVSFSPPAISCDRSHVHWVKFTCLAHEELSVYALAH